MSAGGRPPAQRVSLTERQIDRIINARSVTIGLAATFIGLAVAGAIVMRVADSQNFPSFGLAMWWALQTVTTVGYGDAVPTTAAGRVVGGVEMVVGVSFIAFVTAGVTSAVIQRRDAVAHEAERAARELETKTVLDAVTESRDAVVALGSRLAAIESRLGR